MRINPVYPCIRLILFKALFVYPRNSLFVVLNSRKKYMLYNQSLTNNTNCQRTINISRIKICHNSQNVRKLVLEYLVMF